MSALATMTLNLSVPEMEALNTLSRQTALTKTAVMRQALRLYQWHHMHHAAGGTVSYHDGLNPGPMMLQPGFGEATTPEDVGA